MRKRHSHYIQLDLIILLLLFFAISIISIYNAQKIGQFPTNFALKQVTYYGIGIFAIISIQFIELEQLYKASIYIYVVGTLSVVALHFAPGTWAKPVNNAKSWFNHENLPLTIQPSEFAKITLIILLAAIIVHHKKKHTKTRMLLDFWLIFKLVAVTIVPVAFIIQQPDLGTSLVFFFITGILIVLSGINWRTLVVLLTSGLTAVGAFLLFVIKFPTFAEERLKIQLYQINRILTWFNPAEQSSDDRYHIDQSLLTVGSGQLTGKGLQKPEVFLPEAHTDFIFSIIGEAFGFIGGALVIFLFFLLIFRLVTIGMKSLEHNPFGSYVAFGLMALILIHTFQNIGMTIGVTPITGIPLLFVSYGGSPILAVLIGYGIIYKTAVETSQQKDFLF